MIRSVKDFYPASYENEINNTASGIFNMFLGLGQIIGPMYGATMFEKHGFKTTCDTVAIICLSYSILYYMIGDG